MKIEQLAVEHPYYCSDSNYYERNSIKYETMSDFLADWMDNDVDMNLCFRWDVFEKEDDEENKTGAYRAKIFIMHQRKGKFQPIIIDSFDQSEADQFIEYLEKHKNKIMQLWSPLVDNNQ